MMGYELLERAPGRNVWPTALSICESWGATLARAWAYGKDHGLASAATLNRILVLVKHCLASGRIVKRCDLLNTGSEICRQHVDRQKSICARKPRIKAVFARRDPGSTTCKSGVMRKYGVTA